MLDIAVGERRSVSEFEQLHVVPDDAHIIVELLFDPESIARIRNCYNKIVTFSGESKVGGDNAGTKDDFVILAREDVVHVVANNVMPGTSPERIDVTAVRTVQHIVAATRREDIVG